MTDKEKIRYWAKGRLFEVMNGRGEQDAKSVLTDLLSLIETMSDVPEKDFGKKENPVVKVWHDAEEAPEMYRKYLARYSDGRINGSWERHDDGFIPWKDVVKEHKIIQWCYVEDLLKIL